MSFLVGVVRCRRCGLQSLALAVKNYTTMTEEAPYAQTTPAPDANIEIRDRNEAKLHESAHVLSVLPYPSIGRCAGWLAHRIRDNYNQSTIESEWEKPVIVRSVGTNATNSAVKILAVTRLYLQANPGIDIGFRVAHETNENKDRVSRIRFAVALMKDYPAVNAEELGEIRVSRSSRGRYLGGTIARALLARPCVKTVAIGPVLVGTAIVSCTWARRILHHHGFDAIAAPLKKSVVGKKSGNEVQAIQLTIQRVPYQRLDYLDPIESFDDDINDRGDKILSNESL